MRSALWTSVAPLSCGSRMQTAAAYTQTPHWSGETQKWTVACQVCCPEMDCAGTESRLCSSVSLWKLNEPFYIFYSYTYIQLCTKSTIKDQKLFLWGVSVRFQQCFDLSPVCLKNNYDRVKPLDLIIPPVWSHLIWFNLEKIMCCHSLDWSSSL